jgi:hypothetical protein
VCDLLFAPLALQYELLQQVTDEKDKYLCVFTVCTIEEGNDGLRVSDAACWC